MIPPLPYFRRCDGLRGAHATIQKPPKDEEHAEEQGVNRARTSLPGREPFLLSRSASSRSPVVAGSNADRVTVRPEVIRSPARDIVSRRCSCSCSCSKHAQSRAQAGAGESPPISLSILLGLEQRREQVVEQDLNRSRTGPPATVRYGLLSCYFCVCLVYVRGRPAWPYPGETRKGSVPRCRIMQGAAGMKMPGGRHGMSERCEVV